MKRTQAYTLIGFLLAALVLSGCSTTRHLAEDEKLLTKMSIKTSESGLDKDELHTIVKQTPNRKILGIIPFYLGVYNMASYGKKNGRDTSTVNTWLRENVGEAPVILDPLKTQATTRQLGIYLRNKGYFNATVTDSTKIKGKKAEVTYYITAKEPYKIRRISFNIEDTAMVEPVRASARKTTMRPGQNYDVDQLTAERERMSRDLRNQGYYKFAKEYIYFQVDSSLNNHRVAITMKVQSPRERVRLDANRDTVIVGQHDRWRISNIYVHTNYNPKDSSAYIRDTIFYEGIHIFNPQTLQFKPEILRNAIQLNTGDLFKQSNVDLTQQRLGVMRTFKFINVRFEELPGNRLNCYINLTPAPRKSIALTTEGTHRGGNLGISGNLVYKNRNTFKGAEVLEIRMSGGLEAQNSRTIATAQTSGERRVFNTLEFGPEATLYFPKLVAPNWLKGRFRQFSPTTNITANYNYQNRPDFERQVAGLKFGYSWRTDGFSVHQIDLVDVSFVGVDRTPAFDAFLDRLNNRFLTNSYTDHFILSTRYTYVFNNQQINKQTNSRYLKTSIEGAGNTAYAINTVFDPEHTDTTTYNLFGQRFAQYVKVDADYRYYNRVNRWSNLVYRAYIGIGVPLTNLDVLPFEKSFWSGGANGMRAWQARTLGPGSLSRIGLSSLDQTGDLKLEGNIEYRFNIIRMLEGAAFVDAGNIWLIRNDTLLEGGVFETNDFYDEIGLGAGLGARLDFSFFIVRFDAAIPIKNPALPSGERWIWEPKDQYNALFQDYFDTLGSGQTYRGYRTRMVMNLGIGYPF